MLSFGASGTARGRTWSRAGCLGSGTPSGVPWFGYSVRGALLGRRLSADEMVEDFKPAMSQYQLELGKLEEDVNGFKKLYNGLGAEITSKITSVEERIANLKRMKPE